MCRTKEYRQCPDQEDQVLLRQHPAACHSHDADHRYQKLDQCDQFAYQVLLSISRSLCLISSILVCYCTVSVNVIGSEVLPSLSCT